MPSRCAAYTTEDARISSPSVRILNPPGQGCTSLTDTPSAKRAPAAAAVRATALAASSGSTDPPPSMTYPPQKPRPSARSRTSVAESHRTGEAGRAHRLIGTSDDLLGVGLGQDMSARQIEVYRIGVPPCPQQIGEPLYGTKAELPQVFCSFGPEVMHDQLVGLPKRGGEDANRPRGHPLTQSFPLGERNPEARAGEVVRGRRACDAPSHHHDVGGLGGCTGLGSVR